MSWVALGVGAVGAIGSGIAAYSSSQQQKNAANGLAGAGYSVPDYGKTIDYLNNSWSLPQYENYTPTSSSQGYEDFMSNGKYLPKINSLLNRTDKKQNRQFRQQLFKTSPTLHGNYLQQGTNTASQLRGEVPSDVAQQIQRNTAEQSIFGGYGGSGMSRNLTSRDLGLTSLDMMQRGNQGLQQQLGITQALNPYHSNAMDYLINPNQFLTEEIGQNQFGTNVYNSNQTNSSQIANQRAEMIARLMQGQADNNATGVNTQNMLNYQNALAPNPTTTAITTGLGSFASSYGGSGGAGGWGSLFNGATGGGPTYGGSNYSSSNNGGWGTSNGKYWNPNV